MTGSQIDGIVRPRGRSSNPISPLVGFVLLFGATSPLHPVGVAATKSAVAHRETNRDAQIDVPMVRMIYLVPSDRSPQEGYRLAIEKAIQELQAFYRQQLGNGKTFLLHEPVVEVLRTEHPVSWYQTDAPASSDSGRFYESVLADGFALTGGGFNDPSNRWVFYVDAEPLCGQYQGGTSGIAVLSSNDPRGLVCDGNFDDCTGGAVDSGGVCRWVGGLGHELGHAFNLPHPTVGTCPQPDADCSHALMWTGYASFPDAYLLPSDKDSLLNSPPTSGFFVDYEPPPLAFSCDGGCPPARPTALTAVYANGEIELAWQPAERAVGYAVWRGASEMDVPVLLSSGLTEPIYTDMAATPGTRYYYRVTASNGSGISGDSNVASAAIPAPVARAIPELSGSRHGTPRAVEPRP